MTRFHTLSVAVALAFATLYPVASVAETAAAKAARDDITATFGAVPTFVGSIADAALPGIWDQVKNFEMSPDTALDAKTKSLISLAVAAQIPCDYCISADTVSARKAGATDQEIAEAVAMAGLTRNMSTILHGMQVDLATFKAETGGM